MRQKSSSCGPVNGVVGRILSRIYNLPLEDPIEIIADYPQEGAILSEAHEKNSAGVTIKCHGCSGVIWLTWEDVPAVIDVLMQVLKDSEPNPSDDLPPASGGPVDRVVG